MTIFGCSEKSEFLIKACENRTKEGRYINYFLKDMREGIAKYVRDITHTNGYPSFFTKCLPIQCSPEFKECLGVDNYSIPVTNTIANSYGALVDTVKSLCTSEQKDKIVFCVFCVINLSEPGLAVDPPPIPYIDITGLQQYYKMLENIDLDITFRDVTVILKNIKESMDKIINSKQITEYTKTDTGFKSGLEGFLTAIEQYKDPLQKGDLSAILQNVKSFISIITNLNASTPIGTLLFADSMAKSFVEVNTCNVSSPAKYNGGNSRKKYSNKVSRNTKKK